MAATGGSPASREGARYLRPSPSLRVTDDFPISLHRQPSRSVTENLTSRDCHISPCLPVRPGLRLFRAGNITRCRARVQGVTEAQVRRRQVSQKEAGLRQVYGSVTVATHTDTSQGKSLTRTLIFNG